MLTRYQTFADRRGSSNSVAKLKALRLPDLRGKSFLDVGCNEGFFCAIAKLAGAQPVVGIDRSGEVLEQARQRFPGIEFRQQSWDEPIEGSFDVILFASAIHYADDQPALLRKLLDRLNPDGVLVLELGLSGEPGAKYVRVRRAAGDVRSYATLGALRRVLPDCAVRLAGPSVNQGGDPVPRYVVHIRKLRPMILFFDAPSQSGKSALVRRLVHGRERGAEGFAYVALDGILSRMRPELAAEYPAHEAVIRAISDYKQNESRRTDLIMLLAIQKGLLHPLLAFIEDFHALPEALAIVWDGYLPPEAKEDVRDYFESRGYVVWDTEPRRSFKFPRIDAEALLAAFWGEGEAAPAPAPATLADDEPEAGEDIATPAAVHLTGTLLRCTVNDSGLLIEGWAADLKRGAAAEGFAVRINGQMVQAFEATAVYRPAPCVKLGLDRRLELGFAIAVSFAALGGAEAFFAGISRPGASLKVEVAAVAGGSEVMWLPQAAEFKVVWR